MLLLKITCSFIISTLFAFRELHAQSLLPDSLFYRQVIDNTRLLYKHTVKENLHLYNGREYIGLYDRTIGHPFFGSEKFQNGSIFYDGSLYENVPMKYDLVANEIIVASHSNDFTIKLLNEKISYFSLLNHRFIHLSQDSITDVGLNAGFYDVLYNDKLTVLGERKKRAVRSLRAEDPAKFEQSVRHFVINNNTLYQVDSRASLVALFPDKKDEIKKYLRQNKINYKKNPDDAILKVVQYYTQLKN